MWEECGILPMTEIKNENFGQSNYDSNDLNHVPSLLDIIGIKGLILEIV
jgi:hypothetical protein